MKVLVITVLCALASCAAGGAIAWPGAIAVSSPLLKTIIPGETKTTAYSTTQYINALPASYSLTAHPQFAYQVPQLNSFTSLYPGYYPVGGQQFISSPNVFYPSGPSFAPVLGSGFPVAPVAPAFPSAPAPPSPANPQAPSAQPAGDADSAVVDSAEFNNEQPKRPESGPTPPAPQQPQEPGSAQPAAPQFPIPQFPSNTFPNFPTFPQNPQEEGQAPSFPQLPQLPQISGFPQFPPNAFPQNPSPSQPPPSNFPAAINDPMGLSDEDTVAVESA